MVQRQIGILCIVTLIAALVSCEKPESASSNGSVTTVSASSERCPHDIRADKCPFCTPSLIDSDGFCGEHGVPEALCYQCRPYLKTAFRNDDDWCAEHDRPESQCTICHPELAEKLKPGSGHGVAAPTESDETDHDHDDHDHDH